MSYTHKIYIGYDSKQAIASDVCEYSIRKHLQRVPELYEIHHLKTGCRTDYILVKIASRFSYTSF